MAGDRRHYWIYILELSNGALYTGYSVNLLRRYREHLAGRGARTTRSFPPVRIARCWRIVTDTGTVLRLEVLIKRLGRPGKERLIEEPERIKELAREKLGIRRGPYIFDETRVDQAARDSSVASDPDPFCTEPRRDLP